MRLQQPVETLDQQSRDLTLRLLRIAKPGNWRIAKSYRDARESGPPILGGLRAMWIITWASPVQPC
jgi:hypothetical protein